MAEGRRWGAGTFLLAWAVLAGGQVAAVSQLSDNPGLAGAIVVALQLAKVPISLPRLRDLARPADDVLYALLPPLNFALFFGLLASAPKGRQREQKEAALATQMTALDAWGRALGRARDTASVALLPTLVLGMLAAFAVEGLGALIKDLIPATDAEAAGASQALLAATGFCGVYGLVQYLKRDTASLASWLPAAFTVPLLLLWASFSFRGQAGQIGVFLSTLPPMAAAFSVGALIHGLLATIWVLAAEDVRKGTPRGLGDVLGRAKGLALGVGALSAFRTQLGTLGFQLTIIGGVWFSVSYAFADLVAIRNPARPALVTSHALVRTVRSKVFKILLLWVVLTMLLTTAAWSPFLSLGEIVSALVAVPTLAGPELHVLSGFIGTLCSWLCTLAMLEVMHEREAKLAAREMEARQANLTNEGGPPPAAV